MRFANVLLFILTMTISVGAFSQNQALEKAVVVSGGTAEFAAPFNDFASIGYYNPANGVYSFQDSIYSQSVQDAFIRNNTIIFGAQDSVIQYDIENQKRLQQFRFPQVSFIAGGEGRLAASNFSFGNPDFPYVSFFDTAGFTPIDTIRNDSLRGGGVDGAFYQDKAYVTFNIPKVNTPSEDSVGRLAVYNFNNTSREANIDLGSQGAGVSKVFAYNNQIHAVSEQEGQLVTYDPQAGTVSYQSLGFAAESSVKGPLKDQLYAVDTGREVVSFNLQNGNTTKTGINVNAFQLGQFGGINAFTYDTVNQQAYVGFTDFSDTGFVEVYDQSGTVDRFETNIAVANILLDYEDSATVGIADHEGFEAQAHVYPNPAEDQVHVELNTTQSGEAVVSIRNLSGQLIRRKAAALNNGSNQLTFSLNEAQQGVYLITVQQNDKRHTAKILVK